MNDTKRCCSNCRKMKRLVKYDYSHGGCEHTEYEGYACLIFTYKGIVTHMVGCDPQVEYCEEWSGGD